MQVNTLAAVIEACDTAITASSCTYVLSDIAEPDCVLTRREHLDFLRGPTLFCEAGSRLCCGSEGPSEGQPNTRCTRGTRLAHCLLPTICLPMQLEFALTRKSRRRM